MASAAKISHTSVAKSSDESVKDNMNVCTNEASDTKKAQKKKPKPPPPPRPPTPPIISAASFDMATEKPGKSRDKSRSPPRSPPPSPEDREDGSSSPELESETSKWQQLMSKSAGLWHTSSLKITASTSTATKKFSSVVQLAKKAAKETKHRMGPAADKITLIHFNDVYNVEPRDQDPEGGAARFCAAVKSFNHLNPMILFSGDIFAPSHMSTFTKGEQMIPVLNSIGVNCAVFGNHDFDFGIDTLVELADKTSCPWLMSNCIDNETGRPLAEGKVTHILEWWGRKIGLIGLIEREWLDLMSNIEPEELTYTDYVESGSMLARELKSKGCDFVIALTHMRMPNDVRLAENVPEIDLILGGHDHIYDKMKVNNTWILKSGTDFRNFSIITVDFSQTPIDVSIEEITVSKAYFEEEDEDVKSALEQYVQRVQDEYCQELGEFQCDLDGRFSSIRTKETNLGNFVCDIMVAATNADFALLNSGTLRSDTIHPAGPFYVKDLVSILPMIDPLVLLEINGAQIKGCLENGVSQWPRLEGRFPQVSGISFAFDPSKPAGSRVEPKFIKIGDEYVEPDKTYRMVTKAYLANGKDGYEIMASCKVLMDEENGPQLRTAVQNHFKALAMREGRTRRSSVHHQSLITLSRRTSIVRQLTEDGKQRLPTRMPDKITKQASIIVDLEATVLNPQVESRIKLLNSPEAESVLCVS